MMLKQSKNSQDKSKAMKDEPKAINRNITAENILKEFEESEVHFFSR